MGGGAAPAKTSDSLKAKAKDLKNLAAVNRAIADDNWNRGNYLAASAGYAKARSQEAEAAAYEAAAKAYEVLGD